MDRNSKNAYSAPVLVARGSFSTRTLESPVVTLEQEELQPDKFRIAANL